MGLKQQSQELTEKTGTEQGPIERGQRVRYETRHGYSEGVCLGSPKNNFDVIVVRKTASYTEEVNKHMILKIFDEKYNFVTHEWEEME